MPMDKTTRRLPVCEAIKLLLARMDSHPEEFRKYSGGGGHNSKFGKWMDLIGGTNGDSHYNAKEKYLIKRKLRAIRTQEAHERLMKALLTGVK